MKGTMWKTTIREIRQSLGRYLAILAIVALGVGLFSGLKIMKPLMVETADQYLTEKNLFDLQLLSTYGFEEEDLEALASADGVRAISGSFTYDVLYQMEESDHVMTAKVHTLLEGINELSLVHGRLPKRAGECVVDSLIFGESAVGKSIFLTDLNEEDTLDAFAVKEFEIVGVADASAYMQMERGNTSIGNGKIDGFLYVLPETYDSEIFSEIYVRLDENHELYSTEYEDYIEDQTLLWESYVEDVADQRFARIQTDAYRELEDARAEFETEKADAQAELDDAKQQLADAAIEIADGKSQIADGYQQLAKGRDELEAGKREIADGYALLDKNEQTLEDGARELDANKILLEEKEAELQNGIALWQDGMNEIAAGKQELAAAWSELEAQEAVLAEGEGALTEAENELLSNEALLMEQEEEILANEAVLDETEAQLAASEQELMTLQGMLDSGMIPETQIPIYEAQLAEGLAQLEAGKQQLAAARSQLEEGKIQIEAAKGELAVGKAELEAKKAELAAGKEQLAAGRELLLANQTSLEAGEAKMQDAWADLEDGKSQLEAGKSELAAGEAEIASGRRQIADGRRELAAAEEELLRGEQELADARSELKKAEAELADGEAEYADGLLEYEDGLAEFEEKIADAEIEIADAEKEIQDMEQPDTYVLGRDTNVGYVSLDNDSSIVQDISAVFPVFFFLIAALVCMTTMNRMIEEQRTQIGVLKALGYSSSTIMGKYLFYSGSAAGIGCVLGYFLGTIFLTKIIWMAYGMMYNLGDLVYEIDWMLALISLICSMLCTMGVTWFSCRKELNEVAASLMRPKAPKVGKRVFLEYIPFIWKRLSFLVKVSIRNVLRYKKRFFMMIVGISGSMALLVTGFGIQDSVSDVIRMQYEEIQIYDINTSFRNAPDQEVQEAFDQIVKGHASEYDLFMEGSLDLNVRGNTKSVSMVVPEKPESFAQYTNLHTLDGEPIPFPENGEVVISHKLCENFGISVGDTVELMDSDHQAFQVTVSGICQNFINNYVFLHPDTCSSLWKAPEYKNIYLNLPEETDMDVYQFSAELMSMDEMANVTVSEDVMERFDNTMQTMDYLVMVIIMCAAALAFIVLYNLTNINITERVREIATIKVLGFNKKETAAYVFRENVALTAIGAFIGLFVGKIFHAFVMSCINIDMIAFDVRVKPISYVYSILLTFVFAWIVNMFMTGKLERISMTESLKSVD